MAGPHISIFRRCHMTAPYGLKTPPLPRANRGKVFKSDFNWISQYEAQNQNLSAVARFLAFLGRIQNKQCHLIFESQRAAPPPAPSNKALEVLMLATR